MLALALLVVAYLCGSIPTGVLLSRRRGVDPRDIGSGNIGATNVARAAGPAAGLLTLAGDTLKGLLPVLIAGALGLSSTTIALVGLAAFLGHLYSCFLGFDGGKGVATTLGVLIGLAPSCAALLAAAFVLTIALARYVSLASLLAAALTAPLLLALGYPAATVLVGLVMSALVTLRHRDNIRRLRFGTEPRIGVARPSEADSGLA
ncbi:MAG: glycerol-3-phosphate 1-O-acyltransferase PlsY [Deltaproteobacteria bacterium]|nr:glycerol-3-phosphate 1-O-acyltransferase PlsY [Deltaproteobacteria bacterium]